MLNEWVSCNKEKFRHATYAPCCPHDIKINETIMASRKDPITENVIDPLWQFAKQSKMLINVCTKPDRKEFAKIATATSVGFLIMGFIGFFVKLVHIPINQIIVGGN